MNYGNSVLDARNRTEDMIQQRKHKTIKYKFLRLLSDAIVIGLIILIVIGCVYLFNYISPYGGLAPSLTMETIP
jgi:hypothetical protein